MAATFKSNDLVRYSVSGIDAKTTGTTTLFTTDAGRVFVPTSVVVYCSAATAITVPASISIGTNGAAYDNMVAPSTLSALTAAGLFTVPVLTVGGTAATASTAVVLNITTAATGTSQTIEVDVIGFYL